MKLKVDYLYKVKTRGNWQLADDVMIVTEITKVETVEHMKGKGLITYVPKRDTPLTWDIPCQNAYEVGDGRNPRDGWVFKEIGHKDDHPEYYL